MTPDRASVLEAMSGDLTAAEWSQRLDVSAPEVRAWCATRSLPLRGDPRHGITDIAARVDAERRRLGLSLVATAKAVGVDVKTIRALRSRSFLHAHIAAALHGWLRRVEVTP